ncbi:hypothetical protein E8K88_02755 [Lampropedia aestuarii]|uniref:Uncharacterized protein n=1 Tax=Lampropedia aestuarii TaxID=2562762 RepID=A0A4S5BY17_9BURK|nr:hypothetical protein [Lampropedia aestuarii]MDH5857761.1 hypothetical protein [Lampropedia aestuarii]THJ36201.1 hypothetical protein E8K88_02755 [Lampropedia aestuarii]
MNREQRRLAAKLAKNPPKPQRSRKLFSIAPLHMMNDCRTYAEGELTLDHIKIRTCFARLRDGSGNDDDFNRVAVAINLAKVRALEIDEILADSIEVAQDAMMRCKARFYSHGRFGFDGPGLQAVLNALDANEEIVQNSSPRQMEKALHVVRDVLASAHRKGPRMSEIIM